MNKRFFIHGSAGQRPASARTIYCDGGQDDRFRPGIDLELSHWIPNQTPERYKASTSTEICFNYIAAEGNRDDFDLVVNNHIDIDGILSLFVVLSGDAVLEHRHTIVQAAEMGDFWGWGDRPAQVLFQALTLLKNRLVLAATDPRDVYGRCFELALQVLGGVSPPEVNEGIEALADSIRLIDSGKVVRTEIGSRFVQYAIPAAIAGWALSACLHVPKFNAPLSGQCLLWPHARARRDSERIQLLSVETRGGWYYDLWYPGYAWADTPALWRAPGLISTGDGNVHHLDHPPLRQAAAELGKAESARGDWTVASKLSPFAGLTGRGFPVVLAFVKNGAPDASSLAPPFVLDRLQKAFCGESP